MHERIFVADRAAPDVPSVPASPRGRLRAAWDWGVEFYECLDRSRTFGLAAETAFWLFLSMIPLAAVGGLIAARLSE
jgi:uncharacterized BrkB/YihY/UPF0761 family membrane protein